ncbi:MAG: hypothetical protein KatS3mg087_2008 [Patescibacteria group bacterium]|nr:MAG: hypothetical protein KatS3mg087_2008 [Patescibacteria group bacterium]
MLHTLDKYKGVISDRVFEHQKKEIKAKIDLLVQEVKRIGGL